MKSTDYTTALLEKISPELKKRLEKIAVFQKKTVGDVIVSFLSKGANTPLILGSRC